MVIKIGKYIIGLKWLQKPKIVKWRYEDGIVTIKYKNDIYNIKAGVGTIDINFNGIIAVTVTYIDSLIEDKFMQFKVSLIDLNQKTIREFINPTYGVSTNKYRPLILDYNVHKERYDKRTKNLFNKNDILIRIEQLYFTGKEIWFIPYINFDEDQVVFFDLINGEKYQASIKEAEKIIIENLIELDKDDKIKIVHQCEQFLTLFKTDKSSLFFLDKDKESDEVKVIYPFGIKL